MNNHYHKIIEKKLGQNNYNIYKKLKQIKKTLELATL